MTIKEQNWWLKSQKAREQVDVRDSGLDEESQLESTYQKSNTDGAKKDHEITMHASSRSPNTRPSDVPGALEEYDTAEIEKIIMEESKNYDTDEIDHIEKLMEEWIYKENLLLEKLSPQKELALQRHREIMKKIREANKKSHSDEITAVAGVLELDEEPQRVRRNSADGEKEDPETNMPTNGSPNAQQGPDADAAENAAFLQYVFGFFMVLLAFLLVYFNRAVPLAMISMFLSIAFMVPRHEQTHRFLLAWPFLFYSALTILVVLEDVYSSGRLGLLIIFLAVYTLLALPVAISALYPKEVSSNLSISDDTKVEPCFGCGYFIVGCVLGACGALCIVLVVKIKEMPGTQGTISALLWIWGVMFSFFGIQCFKLYCGI